MVRPRPYVAAERVSLVPHVQLADAEGAAWDPRVKFLISASGESPLDGQDVQQRLGRMLVLAGTRVDDGNAPLVLPGVGQVVHHVGAAPGQVGFRAPHHDRVEVTGEHADGIEIRFALGLGRHLRVAGVLDPHPQQPGRRREGKESPRRGLREIQEHVQVRQQLRQLLSPLGGLGDLPDLLGHLAQVVDPLPVKLRRQDHVSQPPFAFQERRFLADGQIHTQVG